MKVVARNKKAFHDYEILDKYEAGIELKGSEVKAIRKGRVNLKDSYIKIQDSQAWWMQGHISNLETTNAYFKHDPTRPRRLLLHKKEIAKLAGAVSQKGYSIIPLDLHFNHKNKAKLTIAVARGKKLHDKRQALKETQLKREAQSAMKKWF
ncbi:MAG: SsrA-binding protein SmpB [Epsilonproteobacteria bacterium]|nr:SsrA-binding protein SmpB [Campylobacterota bacterium]